MSVLARAVVCEETNIREQRKLLARHIPSIGLAPDLVVAALHEAALQLDGIADEGVLFDALAAIATLSHDQRLE